MISNRFKKALTFLNEPETEAKASPKTDACPESDRAKVYRVLGQDVRWDAEAEVWRGATFTLDDATVARLIEG